MQNKLFVRNLSFNTEDTELKALFSQFGEVISGRVAVDRETGRARGFGFVEMTNAAYAEAAIRNLDNTRFLGRTIHVAVSERRMRTPNAGNW